MKDLIDELHATTRAVGAGKLPAGDAQVVTLSRSYPAEIEDVWDAITDPERVARWFLPVTGDLQLGGHYQLEGNAGGEIRACKPPRHLQLTWNMGDPEGPDDVSIVDVHLDDGDGGGDRTTLTLTHTAIVPPEMWDQFGPGAVGVGWDLTVIGLALHLAGDMRGTPAEMEASPEVRAAMTVSAQAWGAAYQESGVARDVVERTTAATTAFYVPPEE